MSSPVSDRTGRGTSGPYSILRKEDLPGVGTIDPDGGPQRDPARQTGPRRKAQHDPSSSADSFDAEDRIEFPPVQDQPGGGIPPARPRALSIPFATLPPKAMSIPPTPTALASDFGDESGVTRPSAFPPQSALPRGVSRTPSAPSRGYLSRAVCREHGLALSDKGTCLRCEKDKAGLRSWTWTRTLLVMAILAVGIGCAFALQLRP